MLFLVLRFYNRFLSKNNVAMAMAMIMATAAAAVYNITADSIVAWLTGVADGAVVTVASPTAR